MALLDMPMSQVFSLVHLMPSPEPPNCTFTGTKTVLAMVVAEELDVPLERIHVDHADTATTPYSVLSGGSQTTHVNAPIVRAAARGGDRP